MLYIREEMSPPEMDTWLEWHIGESCPKLKARVITFQADGDELGVILEALADHGKPCPNCHYAHSGDCATI